MTTLLLVVSPLSAIAAVFCCVVAIRSDAAPTQARDSSSWVRIARGLAPR
jgi:hypothetical protein